MSGPDQASRRETIEELVTLEMLFAEQGWDWEPGTRQHCLSPNHDDRSPAMQVYPETNSLYCFACAFSGGVVEVTRQAVLGGSSTEAALKWLERRFNIEAGQVAATLPARLQRRFATWRSVPIDDDPAGRQVQSLVRQMFRDVEKTVPLTALRAAAPIKGWVWDQMPEEPGQHVGWAAWARGVIWGSYRELIETAGARTPVASERLADQRSAVRSVLLFDTHRGLE